MINNEAKHNQMLSYNNQYQHDNQREMTIQEAVTILENHNKWRRGDDTLEMEEPKDLGIAIDLITEYFKCISKYYQTLQLRQAPRTRGER